MPIESLVLLLTGVLLGALLFWLATRGGASARTLQTRYVARVDYDTATGQRDALQQQLASTRAELQGAYTHADDVSAQLATRQSDLAVAQRAYEAATEARMRAEAAAAAAQAEVSSLRERLEQQLQQFERMQRAGKEEFANVSHALLQRSGAALREEHARALQQLLDPVRVKLNEFQQQVDRKFSEESKDKASLKAQIEHLTSLNRDLSHEAQQLTLALKGDSKTQGDWGELQLERLLEAAGLQAETHYDTQLSFRAADGRQQRPDCLVRLPRGRCIVVDSKVSLTAYERYCAMADSPEGKPHLAAHVQSLRTHIRQLAAKRYQDLYQIDTPDYVMLFVPLEPAFISAVRERGALFTEALEAGVVLVSPSTLLATMRTVAYIWQQEDQQANAQEIAAVGRKLYEKFCGFVDDMESVGTQLDRARDSYDKAMDKLSRSPKRGTTLVARANELKALGVGSKRTLPD